MELPIHQIVDGLLNMMFTKISRGGAEERRGGAYPDNRRVIAALRQKTKEEIKNKIICPFSSQLKIRLKPNQIKNKIIAANLRLCIGTVPSCNFSEAKS
ncbi:hypothetical protein Pyn_33197 [Prunus yedoensis var. nudiflora]|uniref:Uncharacterized protein n=1 Tax=Prunus yedoensis var. nudiflora TaxID=2094558 RepID=A0A314Y779_PRUYE|nr:hypothetical protein Pyn_33197 [Prunus yedoensis var. nudiflora]